MRGKVWMAVGFLLVIAGSGPAADFAAWKHSGSLFILTTPEGADLPAKASVENFPLLVRLHKDFFDFGRASPKGDDIRFSDDKGVSLAYQIEE